MNGTKPWYQSVGVLGSLVSLVAWFAHLFKFELDAKLLQDLSDWAITLVGVVTAGMALWGRLRASKRITATDDGTSKQNWASNAWLALLLLPALLLLGGCSSFAPPSASYVSADRATYETVAPEYAAYVHADPTLAVDQVQRRDRTLASWKMRIDSAHAPATQPVP